MYSLTYKLEMKLLFDYAMPIYPHTVVLPAGVLVAAANTASTSGNSLSRSNSTFSHSRYHQGGAVKVVRTYERTYEIMEHQIFHAAH